MEKLEWKRSRRQLGVRSDSLDDGKVHAWAQEMLAIFEIALFGKIANVESQVTENAKKLGVGKLELVWCATAAKIMAMARPSSSSSILRLGFFVYAGKL